MTCHYCGATLGFDEGRIDYVREKGRGKKMRTSSGAVAIVRCDDHEACMRRAAEKEREKDAQAKQTV